MEVLVATAIAGLTITAGFRLIAMSYSLLNAMSEERALINAMQEVWLMFRTDEEASSNGTDDKKGYKWEAKEKSVPVDEYELKFRAVTITMRNGRNAVIYVAE